MASSLYNQMNQQSNSTPDQLQTIKNLTNAIQNNSGLTPMSVLNMASQQNPQLAAVMKMVSGSNMTPKQLFSLVAQQRGVDPNQIVNILKNN
jgi:hypothetical protein